MNSFDLFSFEHDPLGMDDDPPAPLKLLKLARSHAVGGLEFDREGLMAFARDVVDATTFDLLYEYAVAGVQAESMGWTLAATRQDFVLRDKRTNEEFGRYTSIDELKRALGPSRS